MLKKLVIFLILILWPLNLWKYHDFPKFELLKTIFENDYQGEQLILRNIHLYPNIPLARTFQNKPRIYIYKLFDNFFAITDPNNYFFGMHPRPIVPDNKNLFKFPFLAIIFFLYGVFNIGKFKNWKSLLSIIAIFIFLLSILKNFDGYDFILWIPISLIIIHGIERISIDNKRLFNFVSLVFVVFAIPEILRTFMH